MPNRFQHTVGIVIEGIGSDLNESGGIAYCYGDTPTAASNYEWLRRLTEIPKSISSQVDPFTGALRTSSFTFTLANTDDVATQLLYTQSTTKLSLSSGIAAATASVTLTGTGSTSLGNQMIWIGDEAIEIGSHGGGGVYPATRGRWSTNATAHEAGDRVYTSNPYLKHRLIKLVTHDREDGTETTRWRGFVEQIKTAKNGEVIQIRCREVFAAIQDATINRGAPKLTLGGSLARVDGLDYPILAGQITHDARASKTGSHTIAIQVGDTLTVGTWTSGKTIIIASQVTEWKAPTFEWDSDTQVAGRNGNAVNQLADDLDAYEVFAVFGGRAQASSSTRGLTYWRHPFAIAMALMVSNYGDASGYNQLGGDWGAGVPIELFDTTAIDALIAATADLKIDRLLLGWDGEDVNVFQVTTELLLRPYGATWGITEDGLITIVRMNVINVDEYTTSAANAVKPLPPRLDWEGTKTNTFTQVIGEFGRLPWQDPDPQLVESRDGTRADSIRRSIFTRKSQLTFDYSTRSTPANAAIDDARLINASVRGYYGIPSISIHALDSSVTGVTYDHGAVITLDDPGLRDAWFVGPDGTRTTLSGSALVSFTGRIIGRKYDIATNTYTLDLLLTNWRQAQVSRKRAPAAMLNGSSAGSSTLTVHQNAFHASANDTSFFSVGYGDVVWIIYPDGALVNASSEYASITSVTATTIVIDSTFTAAPDGAIVVVADLDLQVDDPRQWAFSGDSDSTVGSGINEESIDIYG